MLRINPTSFECTAKRLQAVGIRATAFASLSKNDRISVRSENQYSIDLSKSFLSRFYLFDTLKAATQTEANPPKATISHTPLTAGASKYLNVCDRLPAVTALDTDSIVSAATCRPTSDYFFNALDTVLCAVLSLAVCGAPYTDQSLTVGLAIPKDYRDPARMGAILSMIMGLYRAEAELSLQTTASRISTVVADSAPALSLFSLASGTPLPDRFSAEGGKLFLICPAFDIAGLPDFERLRTTLTYLCDLTNSGTLRSARILVREALTDALDSMQTGDLGYELLKPDAVVNRAPRLAVLCETTEPIDGELLGVVSAKDCADETDCDDTTLDSAANCLIPSESPAILLYTAEDDRDADLLASYLSGLDAKVTRVYAQSNGEELALCRAILHSQALIVGLGVELPNTESVRFAVSTLTRAKGQILYPARDRLPARAKGTAVRNGFSDKMLRDLCSFKKD